MNKKVIAIDPGNEQSAMIIWNGKEIEFMCKAPNLEVLEYLEKNIIDEFYPVYDLAVERVASYGMAVGQTTFDTCEWGGRFIQFFEDIKNPQSKHTRVFRKDVKLHHCGHVKAKDSNIIQALKDRFEPGLKPRQRPQAILKGLKADMWQAFALAVYYYDIYIKNQ